MLVSELYDSQKKVNCMSPFNWISCRFIVSQADIFVSGTLSPSRSVCSFPLIAISYMHPMFVAFSSDDTYKQFTVLTLYRLLNNQVT